MRLYGLRPDREARQRFRYRLRHIQKRILRVKPRKHRKIFVVLNAVAQNLTSAAAYWWLFGLWTVALLTFFSALVSANTGALAGTGCVVLASYLLGLLPKLARYSPTMLTAGNALIHGTAQSTDCTPAVLVAILTGAACFAGAVAVFNRKRL